MMRRSKLYTSLQGFLNRFGRSRRRVRSTRRTRFFESLESRLPFAGINGPHAADPPYPQQSFHIHAGLSIYVNGQKVTVPIFNPTPAEIHTHDSTGAIHIHPSTPKTNFITLNDVFTAWRTAADSGNNPNAVVSSTNLLNNLVDTEHSLRMFVNGAETDAFEKYQIHDKDQILLVYGTNPVVTLDTNQGPIVVELFQDVTPNTVANFLTYVNSGAYDSTVFHRYVPGFVIQGGGFETTSQTFTSANQLTSVTTNAAVANEFDNWAITSGTGASVVQGSATVQLGANADLSKVVAGNRIRLAGRDDGLTSSNMFDIVSVNDAANTVTVSQTPSKATTSNVNWAIFPKVNALNTIAMAKQGGDPNSATSQFFINLASNDANLDLQNGGFTVFARVFDVAQPQTTDSSTPANQLLNSSYTNFVNTLTRTNAGGAFTDLPLAGTSQLVTLQTVTGEGEVKGIIFNDLDANGTRGTGEVGRSGVTVYSDANNNQQFDTGEESTTTNATGNYTLRLAPGQHRIRMVAVNATTQSNPQAGYTATVQVGTDILARDFGLVTLAAPTSIDLVAATDSGATSSDNITNFNNSTSQKAPQFLVGGVLAGATVQVLSDGVVIGQATVPTTGGNGTLVVTANGTTSIADGTHTFTASQTLNGNSGAMATASGLSVRIDNTGPQFTSTAPLTANTGIGLNYNTETNEESSGVTYTLQNPPSGATINATTGVVSWTPTIAQLGAAQFTIVATDAAGNASNQAVTLNVTKPPQARIRLAVTDLSGNPLTAINVGNTFQLRAFVSDPRTTPTGVSAIYEDITWNGTVASVIPGTLVYGSSYNQNTSGTITSGLLDEIGASATSTTAVGSGEFQLFQVNMRADAAGSLAFIGNAPDVTPAHNITLFGGTAAVPLDEVDYGQTNAIQVRQVRPSSLAGFVYVDTNNNGTKESGEQPISSVTITLTGTDSFGAAVARTATTGTDGSYKFENINPGSYKLKETQPTGQINNLPILDGTDKIGSQGGTVSANDELTITLAEGTNGTNNNFAELVGHTLDGTVAIDESPSTTGAPTDALSFAGVQISLFSANSQNQPIGDALQSTQINSNGTFSFAGLTTGTYVANVSTPIFLTGGTQNQVVQVGSTSNQTPILVPAVRQAKYISYRDFMNSSPRHGIFAAVAEGATDSVWTAFDNTWRGFSDLSVTLANNGTRLRIEATTTDGAVLFDEIAVTDPRVRVIAREGNTNLYRLAGEADDYNLRSTNSTASALRLDESGAADATAADDTAGSDTSDDTGAEGESSTWSSLFAKSNWHPVPEWAPITASASQAPSNDFVATFPVNSVSQPAPENFSQGDQFGFSRIMDAGEFAIDLNSANANVGDQFKSALEDGASEELDPESVDEAVTEGWNTDELDTVADEFAEMPDGESVSEDLLAILLGDETEELLA